MYWIKRPIIQINIETSWILYFSSSWLNRTHFSNQQPKKYGATRLSTFLGYLVVQDESLSPVVDFAYVFQLLRSPFWVLKFNLIFLSVNVLWIAFFIYFCMILLIVFFCMLLSSSSSCCVLSVCIQHASILCIRIKCYTVHLITNTLKHTHTYTHEKRTGYIFANDME